MGRTKNAIKALIPRHVSNRLCLKVYRVLACVKVPRQIRARNYEHNLLRLRQMDSAALYAQDVYIENQSVWDNIWFGAGFHHTMKYSGCEIIAACNALKALGVFLSPRQLAGLIRYFEAHGAALLGEFGTTPTAVAAYFMQKHFPLAATDKDDDRIVNAMGRRYPVMIATVYNDRKDITKQIHTVCITTDGKGRFVLHNAYRMDRDKKYRASVPYDTLVDAIAHISGQEPKLLYLIGIDKKK